MPGFNLRGVPAVPKMCRGFNFQLNSRGFSQVLPEYLSREPIFCLFIMAWKNEKKQKKTKKKKTNKTKQQQKQKKQQKTTTTTTTKKKKKKTAPPPTTKIQHFAFKCFPSLPRPPTQYLFIWKSSQLLCSGVQEYMYSFI